jgi:hypothetical protein
VHSSIAIVRQSLAAAKRRVAPEAQAIFFRRRHQPRRPPIRMKIHPQLFVALRMLRLRTIYRAENIGNVLKRVVNVCQREFVNEVLGPLVTEFVCNFGRENARPI